jgi:hypothetical protein
MLCDLALCSPVTSANVLIHTSEYHMQKSYFIRNAIAIARVYP